LSAEPNSVNLKMEGAR